MSLLNSASLVVTPNGYKEGTLYSVIPNTTLGDMTVVRATTATRVNSAGLIELVPYNLLQYSEQLNNAFWNIAASGSATFTVTANQTTAPNGTNTADLITITRSATSELSAIYTNVGQGLGTFKNSVWLKAKDNSNVGKTIDLWSWEGLTRGYTKITLTADWVRYEQDTTVFSVSGAELFDFGLLPISYSTSTTLAVEFYIWGAQSVQGSTAKTYFPTTNRINIPRLDYSNGTCPSLLVEPQRTNLMTYSEQLDNAAWTATAITVTANATTSPDGTTNADKLIPTNVSAFHNLYNYNAVLTGNYSFSVFVKKGGYNFVSLQDQFSGVFNSCFDLVNGTVTTFVGSSNIKSYGNDWFLCSVTGNGVGTTVIPSIVPANAISSFPIFTGNGTDGIFAWGVQFEAGAYPTSYIPTTSAAVTRNADVISKTGISALIGQTEGTLFVDVDYDSAIVGNKMLLGLANNVSNFIYLFIDISTIVCNIFSGGTPQCSLQYILPSNARYKIAVAYKNNDFLLYVNGTQVAIDTSGSVPSTSVMYLGNDFTSVYNTENINSAVLFPTRLTNAELASLTTL